MILHFNSNSCGDEDVIFDDDSDFPEVRRALDVSPTVSHQYHHPRRNHIHPEHSLISNISETHQLTKRRPPYQYTVTGADGRTRSLFLTLNPHSTVKKMLQDDPNAAIGNDCIDYNSVDDCGNSSISQYTYPQGLRRFEVEHVIDGQLIAQFLTDASNGVLRSGATAATPRVSISSFIDAHTAPPLPGVADLGLDLSLHRVFPRVMEYAAGSTTPVSSRGTLCKTDIWY